MRKDDLRLLLDFGYWGTHQLLAAAARLTPERFTAPSDLTTRSLRGTLVHALDVEWSWRLRLQGEPPDSWGPEAELRPDDFPTVQDLEARWADDERDMRAWLDGLTDEQLASTPPGAPDGAGPLWRYVLHLIMHGFQQRADAATLLSREGESPGELDFLDYVDPRPPAT
jgi:uncharacterized damage-inducible protein DinB